MARRTLFLGKVGDQRLWFIVDEPGLLGTGCALWA
jgi:hypothetical protein